MKPVKALLLGAGNRGMFCYGNFALKNPGLLQITALAEPDEVKRERMREEHDIAPENLFESWEDAFANLPPVDAVIIAVQDKMHLEPMLRAMKENLHIICEKPIVGSPEDCHAIEKASLEYSKVCMIPHVLKYTPFFSRLKELLDSGRIGRLIGINLIEHVGHIHLSHSFVRGNWRNLAESSPMILAKSCHDMDMLAWLAGSKCESLSSYGALNYFKAENAPQGAPAYCLDGCPHIEKCPYHVSKIYLAENTGWPVNAITTDLSYKGRLKALEEGPYGRCVFRCDNDVVDHQTVNFRFANGVYASFTMSGFTMKIHRNLTLFGTDGEITGDMEDSKIVIDDFISKNTETIDVAEVIGGGHSGGDAGFLRDFTACVLGSGGAGRTMLKDSFESHYMAFAAEKSRLEGGRMIKVEDFRSTNTEATHECNSV